MSYATSDINRYFCHMSVGKTTFFQARRQSVALTLWFELHKVKTRWMKFIFYLEKSFHIVCRWKYKLFCFVHCKKVCCEWFVLQLHLWSTRRRICVTRTPPLYSKFLDKYFKNLFCKTRYTNYYRSNGLGLRPFTLPHFKLSIFKHVANVA